MKQIITATALALLAGCAELPESVRHPFAAQGGTAQPEPASSQAVSPYPYNPPYGD
jgi:hypothetical protein